MQTIINFLVSNILTLGYTGIFILMFLESSFFPFPSEVVMIPAGYLAYKGEMNLYLAIFFGISGSYVGALFNYFLARKYGRKFLIKYGKYFFMTPKKLESLESFFKSHGHISTFNGRLIPVIRQYISMPAGLAKMNLSKFSIYTILGAGIWVVILTMLGYLIGQNQELIKKYLHIVMAILLAFILIITYIYFVRLRNKREKMEGKN